MKPVAIALTVGAVLLVGVIVVVGVATTKNLSFAQEPQSSAASLQPERSNSPSTERDEITARTVESGTEQPRDISRPNLTHPALGSQLDSMVAAGEDSDGATRDAAEEGNGAAADEGSSVLVSIWLSGNADDIAEFIEDHGGDVRDVAPDYIEASTPVALLGRLSEQEGVLRVREVISQSAN